MKISRLVTFSIICVLFLIMFYFMKTFHLTRNYIQTAVPDFKKQFLCSQMVQSWGYGKEKNKQKSANIEGSISMESEKNYTSGLTDLKMVLNGELFPSIITSEDDGRLGNQMCAYASLLYFQKVHGMHAILADWQINQLAEVFKKEKLQITATTINIPTQFSINWEVVATQNPQGAFFPNEEFLENIEEYKYNKFINIGIWPNYLFLYKEILEDIREHLLFKTDLQVLVDQWQADIMLENDSGKEILFVGVHCRRTDYAHQLWKSSGAAMVDHHFFDRAFNIYRSRYNSQTTEVIFLAVSDDPAWIKENFEKHEDVRFGFDFIQRKIKDTDMPAYDLCVLAACNHSIHTYGTFGAWGSLLAGGDVIAATGINPDANTEEDQIYQRAAMEGWVYLDVRDLDNIQEITYAP